MRERLFDAAGGLTAGIVSGLLLLYMLITIRFSLSMPGFLLCLLVGFFLPFCLHFRDSTLMSGTMTAVSFAVAVMYAFYVGTHSAREVVPAVFIGSVLRSASLVHLAEAAGVLTDAVVRAKEHGRIKH